MSSHISLSSPPLSSFDHEFNKLMQAMEKVEGKIIDTQNRKIAVDELRRQSLNKIDSLSRSSVSAVEFLRSTQEVDLLAQESSSLTNRLDFLFIELQDIQERKVHLTAQRDQSFERQASLESQRAKIHKLVVATKSIDARIAESSKHQAHITRIDKRLVKIADQIPPLEATLLPIREKIQSLSAMASGVQEVINGLAAYGLTGYLGRCSPSQRAILNKVAAEVSEQAIRSAGRKPRKKRTAAQKERHKLERRAARRGVPVEALLPGDLIIPTLTPARRHHDRRVTSSGGADGYARRLVTSRALGHAAAIADADHRRACPPEAEATIPPSLPLPLGDGSRLVGFADPHSSLAARGLGPGDLFQAGLLESWLSEPASARIAAKGARSRLTAPLIHLVAAWSPELADRAKSGDLDLPFYHAFRTLSARLDLLGHRAVAVLHLDSTSGHPHLHILISRVREDDLSLWSIDGSQRALALWLHARSTTALTLGNDALPKDIDALAAPGKAAMAAEHLMAAGGLTVIRSPITGGKVEVPIQGPEAAQRIASVGSCSEPLAGGIWLFGAGQDPRAKASWEAAMRAAKKDGDAARVAELLAAKPRNRGYCGEGALTRVGAAGEVGEGRLGGYLGRI